MARTQFHRQTSSRRYVRPPKYLVPPSLPQQKYNDPAQDKISEAHRKVADVKSIMIENIDKVLLRGEKMEILVDRVCLCVCVRGARVRVRACVRACVRTCRRACAPL